MQWIQDSSQSNIGNLNNVRYEAGRQFRNVKEYLEDEIEELETNSKITNNGDFYREIYDFKNGYQPVTNILQDENGDLVADSHSILGR